MLSHLSISNFTIAEQVELEFQHGMTVITGETGAGKSISLDALALALGDRADSKIVRQGTQKAEIHASFDITQLAQAKKWLQQKELDCDDECLLRRVITREGRSRAYINGKPSTLQDLSALGEMLIDIHSQHEHQSLLKKDTHRSLLDAYAGASALASQLQQASKDWQHCDQQLSTLRNNSEEQSARAQLLAYQAQELDELQLGDNELEALEQEQKNLANADKIIADSQLALTLLSNSEANGIIETLHRAEGLLADIADENKPLREAQQLLSSAKIHCDEALQELQHHIDSFEANPERLQEVENRLSSIYDIARKHNVSAQNLPQTHKALKEELSTLQGGDEKIIQLEEQLQKLGENYQKFAQALSKKRSSARKKLTKAVTEQLKLLGMNNCLFEIELDQNKPRPYSPHGQETVEFLIATNPGQTPQALNKIASGGELSRISLAIQVVTAKTGAIPTLVFDEVDVGIGGGTAEVVGNLLRKLGEQTQVICVTHQAQVASKGNQHFMVSKQAEKNSTHTHVENLTAAGKIDEIARMLGGIEITERTLAHAKEMLTLEI